MRDKDRTENTDEKIFEFARKIFLITNNIQLEWNRETDTVIAKKGNEKTEFGFDLLRI
mgnify:CR=1 FL=1